MNTLGSVIHTALRQCYLRVGDTAKFVRNHRSPLTSHHSARLVQGADDGTLPGVHREGTGGLYLGPHGASREFPGEERFGRAVQHGPLFWSAPVLVNSVCVGQ